MGFQNEESSSHQSDPLLADFFECNPILPTHNGDAIPTFNDILSSTSSTEADDKENKPTLHCNARNDDQGDNDLSSSTKNGGSAKHKQIEAIPGNSNESFNEGGIENRESSMNHGSAHLDNHLKEPNKADNNKDDSGLRDHSSQHNTDCINLSQTLHFEESSSHSSRDDAGDDEEEDDDDDDGGSVSTKTAVHTVEIQFEPDDGFSAPLWGETNDDDNYNDNDSSMWSSSSDSISLTENLVDVRELSNRKSTDTNINEISQPFTTSSPSAKVESDSRQHMSPNQTEEIKKQSDQNLPPSFTSSRWCAVKIASPLLPKHQYPSPEVAKETNRSLVNQSNFQGLSRGKKLTPRSASEGESDPARAKLQLKLAKALDKIDHLVETHQKERNQWQASMVKLARIEREYHTALSEGRTWANKFNEKCNTVSEQESQLQSLRSTTSAGIPGKPATFQSRAEEAQAELTKARQRIRILELEVSNARTNHAMDLDTAHSQMWDLSDQLQEVKETNRRLSFLKSQHEERNQHQIGVLQGAVSVLKENVDPIRRLRPCDRGTKRKSLVPRPHVVGFKSLLGPKERHQVLLKSKLQQQRINILEVMSSDLERKHEDKLCGLQATIGKLTEENQSLKSEIGCYVMEKQNLRTDLESLKIEQDVWHRRNHSIVCSLAACSRREAVSNQRSHDVKRQMQALQKELLDSHTAQRRAAHREEALESDLKMLQALCGQLEGDFYGICKKRESLKNTTKQQHDRIRSLQDQMAAMGQDANARATLTQKQIEKFRTEAETSNKALVEVLSRLDMLDKFVDETIASNARQRHLTSHRDEALDQDMRMLQAIIGQLEHDKHNMGKEQIILKGQVEKHKARELLLHETIAVLELETKTTRSELDQSQQHNEKLSGEIDSIKERVGLTIREFQEQLMECNAKEAILQKEKQDLDSLAELATRELELEQERSLQMSNEMDTLQLTANRLEELARLLAEETKKEREAHQEDVGELHATIETMEDQMKVMKLSSMNSIEKLTSQLEAKNTRLNEMQKEVCRLKLNVAIVNKTNDRVSEENLSLQRKHALKHSELNQELERMCNTLEEACTAEVELQQKISRLRVTSAINLSVMGSQLAKAHKDIRRSTLNNAVLNKTIKQLVQGKLAQQKIIAIQYNDMTHKLEEVHGALRKSCCAETEARRTIGRLRLNAAVLLQKTNDQEFQAQKYIERLRLNTAVLNKKNEHLSREIQSIKHRHDAQQSELNQRLGKACQELAKTRILEVESQHTISHLRLNTVVLNKKKDQFLREIQADLSQKLLQTSHDLEKTRNLEVEAQQTICRLRLHAAVLGKKAKQEQAQVQNDISRLKKNTAILNYANERLSQCKQDLEERLALQHEDLTKELEQARNDLEKSQFLEIQARHAILRLQKNVQILNEMNQQLSKDKRHLHQHHNSQIAELNQSMKDIRIHLERQCLEEVETWKVQTMMAKAQTEIANQTMYELQHDVLQLNRILSEAERDRQNKKNEVFDLIRRLDGVTMQP